MAEEADYRFALDLQKRLNSKQDDDDDVIATDFKAPIVAKQKLQMKRSNPRSNLDDEFLNRTQNLVHPMWETLDPTPDVTALFGAFDGKFFQSRLKCVTLEWSKRMYSCAGICYSSKNRFGMSITIRLSEPLLKLRPRKDLVETMLHEMIHAYCFVLNIREGNGGHGPHFKKIMQAINKVAGTNITVYHSFHDEVNLYKQHVWRCNGLCQNRSPFFGYVKRTCNRAPSSNDQWWAAHQESCGGTFLKLQGPEPKKKKKENPKAVVQKGGTDIRKFFGNTSSGVVQKPIKKTGSVPAIKGPIKSNGGGTLLINPKSNSTTSIAKAFPPTSYPGVSSDPFNTDIPRNNGRRNTTVAPGGNLRNVVGFRDLNEGDNDNGGTGPINRNKGEMTGRGYSVGATSSPSTGDGTVDRNRLREIWSKRFGGSVDSDSDDNKGQEKNADAKRRRVSQDKSKDWKQVDDEVMIRDVPVPIVTLSSDDDADDDYDDAEDSDDVSSPQYPTTTKPKPLTAAERQNAIKQEILDDTTNLEDDDIILIDDEYDDNFLEDDNLTAATALADTSIIDEFFGEDTLLSDFLLENDVRPTFSRNIVNPDDDIVTCPVCEQKLKRIQLEEHLSGCTGIAIKVLPPRHALKALAKTTKEAKKGRARPNKKEILRAAGYSEEDLANITASSTDDELTTISLNDSSSSDIQLNDSIRSDRMRNIYKTTRQCPVCAQEIEENEMNEHLDDCLSK